MLVATRPDVGPVLADLVALRAQLESVLLEGPLPREDCTQLLRDLHRVGDLARWCRDATLALAQGTDPRITWREMEEAVGVSYSTLYSRLQRWEREGRGSE